MADYSKEFGEAVRAAIRERPYRTLAGRAGISAAYISDMVQGRIPKRPIVAALAGACELDQQATDSLLALAGYTPTTHLRERWSGTYGTRPADEEEPAAPGAEFFVRELARLREKHGRAIPVDLSQGMESLTVEQARALVAELERQLDAGII